MPKKPPKAWFDKMKKEVKSGNPDYSAEQVRKTVGDIWYNELSESKRQDILEKKEGSFSLEGAEFRNLFSPKYVKWIEIEAELMAQNNYGVWGSVEDANSLLDRAIKDLSNTIQAGVESEVRRIVDEKREEIVADMAESVVEGPDLPQMGPDQRIPESIEQAPAPAPEQAPQTLSPPPASRISDVFKKVHSLLQGKALSKRSMLELRPVGSNMTEVETEDFIVLFSYSTPVAYQDKNTGMFYRTSERYSVTTSRHITKWLEGNDAVEVDQDHLNNLVRTGALEDIFKKDKDKDPKKDKDKKEDKDKKDKPKKKRFKPMLEDKKKRVPFGDLDEDMDDVDSD